MTVPGPESYPKKKTEKTTPLHMYKAAYSFHKYLLIVHYVSGNILK